jgi:hypothetical protein
MKSVKLERQQVSTEPDIKQCLTEIFQLIKIDFPGYLSDLILEFINVGEWGLALETIYDHLDENEIPVSRKAQNLIEKLAIQMKLGERDWHSLQINDNA